MQSIHLIDHKGKFRGSFSNIRNAKNFAHHEHINSYYLKRKDSYTNGIDIVSIVKKHSAGYLVKDKQNHRLILSNLRGYRRIGDNRKIKD